MLFFYYLQTTIHPTLGIEDLFCVKTWSTLYRNDLFSLLSADIYIHFKQVL